MNHVNLRIGLIGCGAATERLHLPALAELRLRPAVLVDPNVDRARRLAAQFNIPAVRDRYESAIDSIDAAIVAVPHTLHAPVCADLLRRGVHVLVEKPLALTARDCAAVIAAARDGKAVLAVGLMRRYLNRLQWVKAALDAGLLGRIESVDIREGAVYCWPVASASLFRRELAGGGVLADTGAHTLDLLSWWFGEPSTTEYFDDNEGGVEADCLIRFTFANGVRATVELSRTRDLRNTAIVRGERGEIEARLNDGAADTLRAAPPALLDFVHNGVSGRALPVHRFRSIFPAQVRDWVRAIETGARPLVSGEDAMRSIALMERCYQVRRPLILPWDEAAVRTDPAPAVAGVR